MRAFETIAAARRVGVRLAGEGDTLYAEPRSRVTPELRAELAAHKAELLALLATEDATGYRVGELVAYAIGGLPGEVVDMTADALTVRWLGRATETRYTPEEAARWLTPVAGPVVASELEARPCSTCGAADRCAARVPMTDDGWACRVALVAGMVEGQPAGDVAPLDRHPGAELVADIEARGLRVRLDGGRLLVGPSALVDEASRALVEAHRDLMAAWLDRRESEAARAAGWSLGAVLRCPRCGERPFAVGTSGWPWRRCAGPAGCGHEWNPEAEL